MSKNPNEEILKKLSAANLKAAAYILINDLKEGVYKKDIVAALDLFTKLPCPETAINLLFIRPDIGKVLTAASDGFIHMTLSVTGTDINEYNEWVKSFNNNLQAVSNIQLFLSKMSKAGGVQVGFHRLRDQKPLYERLNLIGIEKGFFSNGRQFLRDIITSNPSAFRSVIDMVCIHGVYNGQEKFWNGFGIERDAQFYLQSDIMFNISDVIVDAFVVLNASWSHPVL